MKTINRIKKLMVFVLVCALLLPDVTALAGIDGTTDAPPAFGTHMDLFGCVYSDGTWTSEKYKELAAYSEDSRTNTETFTFFLPGPGIDNNGSVETVKDDGTMGEGYIEILSFIPTTRSAAVSTFSADVPTDESSAEEPSADEPSTEEPSAEDPSTEDPSADEPSTEEPSAEDPSTEDPSADEPSTEEPSAEDPSTEDPSADEPSADDPSTEEPSADEPSADEPSADESSVTSAVSVVPSDASGESFAAASVSDNDILPPPPLLKTFPMRDRTRRRAAIL